VWDAVAWYGGDFDKLWLRSEGERESHRTDARIEALWNHAFASYWDWQLGARRDFSGGSAHNVPDRTWTAFGIQGLAPYWFEIEATAYVGDGGRTAARVRAEYELLLTQRLILQPELELNWYDRRDRVREIAGGLSDAEVGLRLRYEIRREIAPYIGVVWKHRRGDDAFARENGFGSDSNAARQARCSPDLHRRHRDRTEVFGIEQPDAIILALCAEHVKQW